MTRYRPTFAGAVILALALLLALYGVRQSLAGHWGDGAAAVVWVVALVVLAWRLDTRAVG